MEPENTGG